jgi:hypothetical protein
MSFKIFQQTVNNLCYEIYNNENETGYMNEIPTNVMIKCVTFLLHIQNAPSSSLGLEIGYPN